MDLRKLLNIDKLQDIYVVANTPAYLYKNFRNELSIQTIAEQFSTQQLKDEFLSISKKENVTMEEFLILYAIYVALTFKESDFTQVRHFFENEGVIYNEWFSDIAQIFIRTYKPIQIINTPNPEKGIFNASNN